ncbi:hypothetical protein [Thiomicrospira sp. WB1]|uniref:hypothetical protein n=1 Tax=Thiomicrospira sp. WB1 TaxID=1685380 RepID=UPI00074A38EC|nr:hypothetical protein [Thiomicrospira sp. WB1]KUJ71498.1 hypothetical protein AVO41_08215 [Thiomicrospira sp. WB1]
MNQTLYWLHDEHLAPPDEIEEGDRLVYIWDDTYFDTQAWSFKRLAFVYETLCSLECEIFQASTVQAIDELSTQSDISTIVTWQAQDPTLSHLIQATQRRHPKLQVRPNAPLVDLQIKPPVKRFFYYWKRVEKMLTGRQNPRTYRRVK